MENKSSSVSAATLSQSPIRPLLATRVTAPPSSIKIPIMRVVSSFTTAAAAIALISSCVDAYPRFVSHIPNAGAISGVQAIGHQRASGGGALNAFGEAFEAQSTQWTAHLCQADSDGDGATNGEELGDPCCKWSVSSPSQLGTQVSHPGVLDSWTPQQLNALKCQEDFSSEAAGATGNAAAAGTPAPVGTPADSAPPAQPRNTAGSGAAASRADDGSTDDDDDLSSTIDPNGLKETPPSLLPQSPAPAKSPTSTPTSAASGSSSNRSFGLKMAAALASLAAGFAL